MRSCDALETGPAHICQLVPRSPKPPALDRQWLVPKHKPCRHSPWLVLATAPALLPDAVVQPRRSRHRDRGRKCEEETRRKAGRGQLPLSHTTTLCRPWAPKPSPLLIALSLESSEAALLVWDGGR